MKILPNDNGTFDIIDGNKHFVNCYLISTSHESDEIGTLREPGRVITNSEVTLTFKVECWGLTKETQVD